jgi:hypothetical protein
MRNLPVFFSKDITNMTTPVSYEDIDQAVEQARPTLERLAGQLWQFSELSLQEVKSARLIMDILRGEGFTITSKTRSPVQLSPPALAAANWRSHPPRHPPSPAQSHGPIRSFPRSQPQLSRSDQKASQRAPHPLGNSE